MSVAYKRFILELFLIFSSSELHILEQLSENLQLFLHNFKGIKSGSFIMLHVAVVT